MNLNLCPDNCDVKMDSALSVMNKNLFDVSSKAIERFMRYLKGVCNRVLIYKKSYRPMVVYGDASFGGDLQYSNSVSGVLILCVKM